MSQKFHVNFVKMHFLFRASTFASVSEGDGRSCNVLSQTLLAKAVLSSSAHFQWKATNGTKTLGLRLTLWFDDAETHWDLRLHPYVTWCIRSTLLMWPEYTAFPALMVYISKLIFPVCHVWSYCRSISMSGLGLFCPFDFTSDPINQPARCELWKRFFVCVFFFFL